MMNYIKSEFYRITHTRGFYGYTALLITLSVLANLAICLVGETYATTSFSFSNLVANPMTFGFMGALTAGLLYEGSRKNGNLKNTVAFGVTRRKIFLGQCLVSLLAAGTAMIFTLAAWISSAILLLKNRGPVKLSHLLWEVPAVILIAAACMVSQILFMEFFDKTYVSIVLWLAIWFLIPKVLFYLSFSIDFLIPIALWFPENLFSTYLSHINTQECITAWDTSQGMIRCLIMGGAGTLLFTLSGLVLLKKKDL